MFGEQCVGQRELQVQELGMFLARKPGRLDRSERGGVCASEVCQVMGQIAWSLTGPWKDLGSRERKKLLRGVEENSDTLLAWL